MKRLRDEDWEYQLQEDTKLAAIPPDEWDRQVAADNERIMNIHRQQARILRRNAYLRPKENHFERNR